jgi:hypothetical protein
MVKRGVFAINNLNTDKQFEFFNLTLTEEEWKLFEKVKIEFDPNAEKPYREKHMFGQLERVEDEAAAFLKNLSDQNSEIAESVAKLIANLVNEILAATGKETAWVVLRGWTPTDMFDIPRWHRDVPILDAPVGQEGHYKFTMALKGPTTMFVRLANDQQDLYVELARELSWIMTAYATEEERLEHRKHLAKILGPVEGPNVIQAPHRSATMFEVGFNGAIHSEPPIHEERLFLSVFAESKEEIEKIATAFGEFKKTDAQFF